MQRDRRREPRPRKVEERVDGAHVEEHHDDRGQAVEGRVGIELKGLEALNGHRISCSKAVST
jgi:hypothetical protein